MYGGQSDSTAVNLAMERLAAILPHSDLRSITLSRYNYRS
jgi:hypothetical protein